MGIVLPGGRRRARAASKHKSSKIPSPPLPLSRLFSLLIKIAALLYFSRRFRSWSLVASSRKPKSKKSKSKRKEKKGEKSRTETRDNTENRDGEKLSQV